MTGGSPSVAGAIGSFALGAGMVVCGLVVYGFRREIRDMTLRSEKKVLGESTGDALGKLQTPYWVGVAALGWAVVGLCIIATGVVDVVQLVTSRSVGT